MANGGVDYLPIVTAIMTAIPTVIGAILVTRSKHKAEVEQAQKMVLDTVRGEADTRSRQVMELQGRFESLENEHWLCEKKMSHIINELATRGLYNEVKDELERLEAAHRGSGDFGRFRGSSRPGQGGPARSAGPAGRGGGPDHRKRGSPFD